ncbi:ribbon-helix-helix domain-containing protein [Sulfurimonas sp.]|uniref:ribbon-helix-helix domain-containing protein n=1 Tax=Sulfurimonas sp. TaxID=2022749 RepID=UPI003567EEB0
MDKKVKSVTFEIPIEILEELDVLSKEINKDKTVMVNEALNMYLAYQELSLQQKPIEDENNKPLTADEFFDDLDI